MTPIREEANPWPREAKSKGAPMNRIVRLTDSNDALRRTRQQLTTGACCLRLRRWRTPMPTPRSIGIHRVQHGVIVDVACHPATQSARGAGSVM